MALNGAANLAQSCPLTRQAGHHLSLSSISADDPKRSFARSTDRGNVISTVDTR
jgi:hypothetical protein